MTSCDFQIREGVTRLEVNAASRLSVPPHLVPLSPPSAPHCLPLLPLVHELRAELRMSFFGTSTSTTLGQNTAVEKDIEVADPPTDSISSVAFSPTADYLAVGSWDNNVRATFSMTRHPSQRNHDASFTINRFGSTKLVQMARRRARRCIPTRGLC